MKTAAQLKTELKPFVEGTGSRCMSEIDGLLADIYGYLTAEAVSSTSPREDPTLTGQLSLDFTPAVWEEVTCLQNSKTGEIRYELKGV
jgi:hypothetical protein